MRPTPARFPVLRPPPLRLVIVALLALIVALAVHRTTSAAADVTARLGATTTVAVARHGAAPGDELEAGDIELVERPVDHVPETATRADPTGRTVRSHIHPGEIVVDERLAGMGRDGPAALVPPDWRAVAIPVIDAPIPARAGDVVDVVASFDPTLVDGEPAVVVAAEAIVVDVADDAITVAVPRRRVTDVAHALANGIVTLALVG
jgi:Flp pilus assembly protein CpaB